MPEYLISDGEELPKFARVDAGGSKLAFVDQASATGFPTPEAAWAAARKAMEAMTAAGMRRVERLREKDQIVLARYATGFVKIKGSDRSALDPLELCVPVWLWGERQGRARLAISSRPTAEDVYGVFESFYARSGEMWLCRSQRRQDGGALVWDRSFGFAAPFSSQEAAEAELRRMGRVGHVLKTSGVFTGVTAMPGAMADDLSSGIQAACEARDIEAALEQSVQERLAAMRQEPDPAPPRAKAQRI